MKTLQGQQKFYIAKLKLPFDNWDYLKESFAQGILIKLRGHVNPCLFLQLNNFLSLKLANQFVSRGIRTLGIICIFVWRGLRFLIISGDNREFESLSIPRPRSLKLFSEKSDFDRQNVDTETLARFYFPSLQVPNFGDQRRESEEKGMENGI